MDGGRCDGLVRRRQWSCEPLLPYCPCSSSFLLLFLSSLPLYFFFSFCFPACLPDWLSLTMPLVVVRLSEISPSSIVSRVSCLSRHHPRAMHAVCVCVWERTNHTIKERQSDKRNRQNDGMHKNDRDDDKGGGLDIEEKPRGAWPRSLSEKFHANQCPRAYHELISFFLL